MLKIKDLKQDHDYHFSEIEPGEVFRLGLYIYLKTTSAASGCRDLDYNAVNLTNYSLASIADNSEVIVVEEPELFIK